MKKAKKKTKRVASRREEREAQRVDREFFAGSTKKKARRKGPRKVTLTPGKLALTDIEGAPAGSIRFFTVWHLPRQRGRVVDMHAVPGDPGVISHILGDIIQSYSQAFATIAGGDPEEYAAMIITHFAEVLEKIYPQVAEMPLPTELGGDPAKVH